MSQIIRGSPARVPFLYPLKMSENQRFIEMEHCRLRA